jgi:hypothetical protein
VAKLSTPILAAVMPATASRSPSSPAKFLPQFAGDLDDGTVRKLLDELAEEMGQTLEQEEVHIAYSGRTWTVTAEPPGP